MPVLVTIATVNALFRGSKGSKDKVSFLNPPGLRVKLEDLREGSARTRALALADRLDLLAKEYNDARDAAISAYAADVKKWATTPDQLSDDLEPLDRMRTKAYQELVEMRQALIDTLSPEEWDQVFG